MEVNVTVVRLRNGDAALIINDQCEIVQPAVGGADVSDLIELGQVMAKDFSAELKIMDLDHVSDWDEAVSMCQPAMAGMTLHFFDEVEHVEAFELA